MLWSLIDKGTAPDKRRTMTTFKDVLITGGTGFIGTNLIDFIAPHGYRATVLTRSPQAHPCNTDAGATTYVASLDQLDPDTHWYGVINLAGEPLNAGRWNPQRKRYYRDSRVNQTHELTAWMKTLQWPPKIFLSGSAIGWYGHWKDECLDENSESRGGYAHELCQDWEQAADHQLPAQTRLCIARIGIVLGAEGGPLPEMVLPARWGLGGPMGSGDQWWSWIHIRDLVRLFLFLLENDQSTGIVNVTAPAPVQQRDFARALGKVLRRPAFLPLPAFAATLLLGEFARELLLNGQRVVPRKAESEGFTYLYPTLDSALQDLLRKR